MTESPGFTTYAGLLGALRLRINDLRLRQLEVDELAGFQSGYTGKLFASAEADNYRRLTKFGLPRLLKSLDCELVLRVTKSRALSENVSQVDQEVTPDLMKKNMAERGAKGGKKAWARASAKRRSKVLAERWRKARKKRRAKAKEGRID